MCLRCPVRPSLNLWDEAPNRRNSAGGHKSIYYRSMPRPSCHDPVKNGVRFHYSGLQSVSDYFFFMTFFLTCLDFFAVFLLTASRGLTDCWDAAGLLAAV